MDLISQRNTLQEIMRNQENIIKKSKLEIEKIQSQQSQESLKLTNTSTKKSINKINNNLITPKNITKKINPMNLTTKNPEIDPIISIYSSNNNKKKIHRINPNHEIIYEIGKSSKDSMKLPKKKSNNNEKSNNNKNKKSNNNENENKKSIKNKSFFQKYFF
jgi:hypothetical protein